MNCRKSSKSSGFAGPDQIGSGAETIPFNLSYIEIDYQVAFFPPALLGPAVKDLETSVHDLEDVAGERSFTVGNMNGNDVRSSKLTGQSRGNLDGHGAVDQQPILVFDGVKQAGIGATGAYGIGQRP